MNGCVIEYNMTIFHIRRHEMELFFTILFWAVVAALCAFILFWIWGFAYCLVIYPLAWILFHLTAIALKCIAAIIYINDSSKADEAYYAINEMRDESLAFCRGHYQFMNGLLVAISGGNKSSTNNSSSDYSYDEHDSYHNINTEADERIREHRRREDERDNARAAKVAQENENRRFQKAYNFLQSLYTHEMKTSGTQLQIQKMNDSFSILWNTNRSNAERQRAMHYIAGIFEGKGLINRHYKHSVICEELGI